MAIGKGKMRGPLVLVLLLAGLANGANMPGGMARAQESLDEAIEGPLPPQLIPDPTPVEPPPPNPEDTATAPQPQNGRRCQPDIGCVTNLPLPRFVSLKGDEGNARRGPGLTHRIDWVFTRPGMPLRVTAEYENWRRVEDQDGAGGWVHYALLSGVRSVLVTLDMAEIRDAPRSDARVVAQAEMGVIGRILECQPDWCRISASGERGWLPKSAIWGVGEAEVIN